jgi:hypothetical protein
VVPPPQGSIVRALDTAKRKTINFALLESLINGLKNKLLASLQPQSIICVINYGWEERGRKL